MGTFRLRTSFPGPNSEPRESAELEEVGGIEVAEFEAWIAESWNDDSWTSGSLAMFVAIAAPTSQSCA